MPLTRYIWRTDDNKVFTDDSKPALGTDSYFSHDDNLEKLPVPGFNLAIDDYEDGDIDGGSTGSTLPPWPGTFPWQTGQVKGPNSTTDKYELFSTWEDDAPSTLGYSIDGDQLFAASVRRQDWTEDTDMPWRLTVEGTGVLWTGKRTGTMTGPEGVYTKDGGSSTGPDTLTVVRV